MLHLVQSEEGHVTRTGMQFCAEMLDLTAAEVTAVATFYTMYRRKPSGDYQVGVCTNTLCAVMGGDAIFDELKEYLGVGNQETTEDGKVTLEHIECNAACDFAPVVMVNWEFFDNQTPESAKRLVDDLRGRRGGAPHPRREAVHVQGDRPHPGRIPRRAPWRRRGVRRCGPRLAHRAAHGQGRGAGRARGQPARPAAPGEPAAGRAGGPAAHAATPVRTTRRSRPPRPTRRTRLPRPRMSPPRRRARDDRRLAGEAADPGALRLLGRPGVLDPGHVPAARGLPGAAQGPHDVARRRHRVRQGQPACAAAAARASRPA